MARDHGMIEPFAERLVGEGKISFGVSSYGYDFRITDEFQVLREGVDGLLDPKDLDPGLFETVRGEHLDLPPHGLALCRSLEYFRIPRDVLTVTFGKSTYARCGVLVNVTPFEPEWEGFVTVAVTNLTARPVRLHAGEGIAQVLFFLADEVCETSYADRKGKYQAQTATTHAKV